jgi:hypothetical protein
MIATGQLILGTDKRNALFTVYEWEEDDGEEQLHVYYGLELLEVVPADRNAPSFKMLVGRLYNAGLSRRVLQETFRVDLKTIQRWAAALRSRNGEELVRVLAGRRAGRKLTPQIEAYVRARWADLSRSGTYGIGKRLRKEIESVFEVKLSQETLRPLVGQLKRQSVAGKYRAGEEPAGTTEESGTVPTTTEGLHQSGDNAPENQRVSSQSEEIACDCSPALPAEPQTVWCDHAGVLVFAPSLLAIAQVLDPPEPRFAQWLASLLLGALNIEQTKFLNWQDMAQLLGSVVRFPHPQRQELGRLATPPSFQGLACFNSRCLGAGEQSDFYFDPHTKQYTGQENVLQGWCPAIRSADKAMHSDFIHTAAGEPLYFETSDNFYDVRQRFFEVVERCRQVLESPQARVLSWVVDRAIFGREVFEKVLNDASMHLITWEKGYQAQSWPPAGGLGGSMVIERTRNRADDIRSYHLQYQDRLWPKEERLRQIVVQATDPKGRSIQVAVLTDDTQRAASEIVRLMFCRWVQENDFKYLDKHFGINQITSYGVLDYEQLREQVEDRQVRSAEIKALGEQRRQLRARQAKLLLLQAQGEHQATLRQRRIEELGQELITNQTRKQLDRLRGAQARWQISSPVRQHQIEALSLELAELELKVETVQKSESRLERLIEEHMVRLDPDKKRLMDNFRVIARNVFYAALGPFKKAYNNYRDDHDQFRQLTQCSGVLEVAAEQIVVHLMPRVNYAPRVRRIITELLAELNAKDPVFPDGSGRGFRLRLASRSELRLSIARGD